MNNASRKILYIEDDDSNRLLVKKILRAAGYDVLLAEDGVSGIDAAMNSHPSLILMDMNMPGLDGYETSTRIKAIESLHDVPIVAVTANVMEGSRERSLISGCDGYIAKPIDPDNFAEKVKNYLGGEREQVNKDKEAPLLREYSEQLVTHLEEKIRELSVALEQAKQSDRIKTEFLSMMNHELRTPLNCIINYPALLIEKYADTLEEQDKDNLKDVIKNGEILNEVVSNIFNFVNLDKSLATAVTGPAVFYDLVELAVNRYQPEAEQRGLEIQNQVDPNLPLIYTDIQHMQKVILILISNAIKFTEQGKITVSCKQVKPDNKLLPDSVYNSIAKEQEHLLLTVSDTGIGIEAKDFEKIFDPFTQLEDPKSFFSMSILGICDLAAARFSRLMAS